MKESAQGYERMRKARVERPREGVSASRYRVIAELGQGGMADVSLAVQAGMTGVKRLAVIKRVRATRATDENFLAMFLQEARLAVRLNHSNVVHSYEVGHDGHGHFLAMEYLRGQSFEAALSKVGHEHFDFAC